MRDQVKLGEELVFEGAEYPGQDAITVKQLENFVLRTRRLMDNT